jgi:hypothetical protein
VVDTVREALEEKFQALLPALEQLLLERGVHLDELGAPAGGKSPLARSGPVFHKQ